MTPGYYWVKINGEWLVGHFGEHVHGTWYVPWLVEDYPTLQDIQAIGPRLDEPRD